jgi:hypothetical protein
MTGRGRTVRAVPEEKLDDGGVVGARGRHQRGQVVAARQPRRNRGVRADPALQQRQHCPPPVVHMLVFLSLTVPPPRPYKPGGRGRDYLWGTATARLERACRAAQTGGRIAGGGGGQEALSLLPAG